MRDARFHPSTVRRAAFVAVLVVLPVLLLGGNRLDHGPGDQARSAPVQADRDLLAILSGTTATTTLAAEATSPPGVTATTSAPTRTPGRSVPTPTPAPTATPTPPPPTPTPEPPANRLAVPSVGIRAVVEVKGLDANMVMQVPDNPFQVAWYDFTASPGTPGNTVFAGHVDHETVGRAAFWTLRNVKIGEIVEYQAIDGQVYRYRVTQITTRSASSPANDLVAPTQAETITLITCAGGFDRRARAYDQRLIVQAVRELP